MTDHSALLVGLGDVACLGVLFRVLGEIIVLVVGATSKVTPLC